MLYYKLSHFFLTSSCTGEALGKGSILYLTRLFFRRVTCNITGKASRLTLTEILSPGFFPLSIVATSVIGVPSIAVSSSLTLMPSIQPAPPRNTDVIIFLPLLVEMFIPKLGSLLSANSSVNV